MPKIPGRAETPKEKRAVVERLYQLWLTYPQLRLGQLVHHLAGDKDTFYVEDGDLVRGAETPSNTG